MAGISPTQNNSTTHGMSGTRLYETYKNMKRRCYDKKTHSYPLYGAKGIIVCNEWKNSPQAFINWALLNGYTNKLTIDRIDNSKNYCPENCRWSTWSEQKINQPINIRNTSGYTGVSWHIRDKFWQSYISIDGKRKYLGKFNTAFDAALARNLCIINNNLPHKEADLSKEI